MAVTYCRAGETTGPIALVSTPGNFTATTVVEVDGGDCDVVTAFVDTQNINFTVTPREDSKTGDREIRIYDDSTNATPVTKTGVVSVLRRGCLGSRIYVYAEIDPTGTAQPTGSSAFDPELPANFQFQYRVSGGGGPVFTSRIYLWDKGDGETLPYWQPADAATGPDLHASVTTRESDVIAGYLEGAQNTWLTNILNYDVARGVMPDEYVDAGGGATVGKKWLGFPDPITNCRLLTHPEDSFFRRPFYYLGTPDYFWSKAALAHATLNQSWLEQAQFGGMPLFYRSTNTSTFDVNYAEPFKLLRDYENDNDMYYWKTPGPPAEVSKAVLVVSIELLELVPPGPCMSDEISNSTDYKQKYVYRRWEKGSSAAAKIRVYSQDMWAFKDYGTGAPLGVHRIGEPVLIAEAFCPRIDLTYDYNNWNTIAQVVPSDVANDGLSPGVTGEATIFKWKEVLSDPSLAVINDSTSVTPLGAADVGAYLTQEKVYQVAKRFLAEFDGYRCKIVFSGKLGWPQTAPVIADLPGSTTNCYTGRGPSPHTPATNYADPITDREGTWVQPTEVYLEVVE